MKPKGEAITFGVFGGIAFVGFLLSFAIRGRNLEAEGWHEDDDDEDDEDIDKSDDERTHLGV